MIPGCHSVVASWDHGGAKRVCLFKRPQAFSCWGASDSPPNPLLAQQQARACRCIKSRGSPKPVAGNVVATSFNLTPLEGWVNLGELVKDTRQ